MLRCHGSQHGSTTLAPSGTSRRNVGIALGLALAAAASLAQPEPPTIDEVFDAQGRTTEAEQRTQARVDALADEARALTSEYRLRLQTLDHTRRYNANLQRTVADQEREKASLARQIEDFGALERGIVPFLLDSVDTLADFVRLDVPFLLAERQDRVARLRALLDRADVSVAEKYRRVMDAYQVEAEFGRTIEAWAGTLDTGDGPRRVEFLRIGRVVLAYLTPDRRAAGYYDTAARQWRPLPARYHAALRQGLRIARKQAAPQILTLPVAAPTQAPP